MKKWSVAALILCVCLLLAACGQKGFIGDKIPVPTAQEAPSDSLGELRSQMKPPIIAVADFGFPELSEDYDVMDYLLEEFPLWVNKNDFVLSIPEERVIKTCGYDVWGQLFCIVPWDPASTVRVIISMPDSEGYYEENVLFHSKDGDPFLLLANTLDDVFISVTVTDSEGRGITWYPSWDDYDVVPEDAYTGHLIMDISQKYTVYNHYVDAGWYTPEAAELGSTLWETDDGYALEFYYDPGQQYDGVANIYCLDETGNYEPIYYGNWVLAGRFLELDMVHMSDDDLSFQGDFPVLLYPEGGTWIWIGENKDGVDLPFFIDVYEGRELKKNGAAIEGSVYDACIAERWYKPERYELMDGFWLSDYGYALELLDNDVPDDNEGWARLYDVGSEGEYIESYTGSWIYEYGYIHLTLVPVNGDGYFVDDTFPVLMDPYGEGGLFIGRNENGIGLPYFPSDLQGDKLDMPMG